MTDSKHGVVLVGHGGIPKDYPPDLVSRLKRLEAQRRSTDSAMSEEEEELDNKIRHWPRTPDTDPYQAGLESLSRHMIPLLKDTLFAIAFNEFCAPTLSESVQHLIGSGAKDITVVSTMFTPGGSHSECEIPSELQQLRSTYPHVTLTYAWPFDLNHVATMLMKHLHVFQEKNLAIT